MSKEKKTKYNHKEIENKWKKLWYDNNIFEAVDFSPKPKKYILAELPYPSGPYLHAGHMMRYTMPDIYVKYLRMKGYNVLYPMGWDSFGLPTEGYAIKANKTPQELIKELSVSFKKSLQDMGYSIDWNREINTCDPSYYKWTQWIFLKFYEAGLAEYKETYVWWSPSVGVLADEEVINNENGEKVAERDGSKVERKIYKQWVLKIPKYAQKLLDGLEETDFPQSIKQAQINWIGKSEGFEINFEIFNDLGNKVGQINTFTTRPDTIFGVTFLTIAPEHSLSQILMQNSKNPTQIQDYINRAKNLSDLERKTQKEKTGVAIEGLYAKHPLNEVERKIPVFVADYVLMDYGTGCVMGVPAHDERDYEFAVKNGIEIIQVITPHQETQRDPQNQNAYQNLNSPTGGTNTQNPHSHNSNDNNYHSPKVSENSEKAYFQGYDNKINGPYTLSQGTMINSYDYNGLDCNEFYKIITQRLENEGKGKKSTAYKIRDWIFSRQRYWGEPIPLIHKQDGSIEAIVNTNNKDEVNKKLPLELPPIDDFKPLPDGSPPLAKVVDWVNTTDSQGNPAKRETQTMPTWAGSSWYYLRYIDPHNNEEFANYEKLRYWLPVDKYFGDGGHTTVHLLYSRFWHRFLYDQGLVPTPEPYKWRMTGGLLLGPDGRKMSKRYGNVVMPMDLIENYGADATRLSIVFLGPYEDTYPWNENTIKAMWRLLNNIYELQEKVVYSNNLKEGPKTQNQKTTNNGNEQTQTIKALNKLIKNVSEMCENLKMNTAVSEIMIFVNHLKKVDKIELEVWKTFIKVIAPFAPFLAEELWQKANNFTQWTKEGSVHLQSWPGYTEETIKEKILTIPVMINGKVRGQVNTSEDDNESTILQKILNNEKLKKYITGKINKTVFIKEKIVSLQVEQK